MTISLEQRIANLSPEKRALLELSLQNKPNNRLVLPSQVTTIQRRATTEPAPLSFAQQRLWFLDQLQPGSAAYNNTNAFQLQGELNIAALQQSLDEIIRRHESLRTTFSQINGEPRQVINPPRSLPLPVVDLCHLPAEQWDAEIQRRSAEENQQTFDLRKDLMRRAILLKLAAQTHIFLLTSHHIASDGWSGSVFWRELSALYAAFAAGQPSPLPELHLQYADYAIWQRQTLQGQGLTHHLDYWRHQLAEAPPLLDLPLDFPRSAEAKSPGKLWRFSLSLPLCGALKTLARQNDATLFMTLLAAFQVLLLRYTNQHDIVVGTPIANRQRPEIEGLIGMFVNTLALRTDLSGNPSFRQLLQRVRMVAFAAYEHQDLPFEKLVEELQPERNLAHHPLFQVMFALQNTPQQVTELAGITVQRLPIESEIAKFDLQLALTESATGLDGRLEYNTTLFAAATIARMADHFTTLLEAIIADPDCPIEQLPILRPQQRQQLLVDWNTTATHYPRHASIHQLFEAQVEQTPSAIALVFAADQLTYYDLNQRANCFANFLCNEGVQVGDVVAICANRSIEMIVAMLAILKNGAAYLPLDPAQPVQRLLLMLEDANVSTLLVDRQGAILFADGNRKTIALDQPLPADSKTGQNLSQPISSAVSAEAPAYVIYTSGSTGTPKGVVIPHRAVVRLVRNTNYIQIAAQDGVAQASNPMFDAATFEIWGALLNGARLVGIEPTTLLSPPQLADFLRQQQISILFITTALFHHIAEIYPSAFQTLRVLLFGGETVSPRWVRRVLKEGSPKQLLHVYGPTENCTFSSWRAVDSVAESAATIAIGQPIANSQMYILDTHLQPVPIGVIGELHVGGDGLAQGYLRQPELSAEKFIGNPFAPGLLYKTGDLAHYLPNGAIEFIGRRDFQLKIRGFRVELGEIEAILNQHPAIKQAIVIASSQQNDGNKSAEKETSEKQLLAYVVPACKDATCKDAFNRTTLNHFLKQRLPAYMIPHEIIPLDALPLTKLGKLDCAALPAPQSKIAQPTAPLTTARDKLELQLVQIWESVLRQRPIGIHDNFFDLGGHSLLAVKLFDQITQGTGRMLPLATLFQTPTIAELATALRRQQEHQIPSPAWQTLTAIRPTGSLPPLFVVPPAASTVLRFAPLLKHLDADLPIYGLQHRGLEDGGDPFTTIEAMAAHYVNEIRRFCPSGPYLLAGICFGAHVALEMAQQFKAQGQTVALLAVIDAGAPSNGPDWDFDFRPVYRLTWHRERLQIAWQSGDWAALVSYYLGIARRRIRPLLQGKQPHDAIQQTHRQAQLGYRAQHYHGRILLLQSKQYANHKFIIERWRSLAPEQFENVSIAGSTHSSLLLSTRYQQPLSQALMNSIYRAINNQ